jgi:GGDEF domain-containing protein
MLDHISGVFNYTAMMPSLSDRLRERRPIRLVAVDIQDMRHLNPTLGVEIGNALLEKWQIFPEHLRDLDFRMTAPAFWSVTLDEQVFLT